MKIELTRQKVHNEFAKKVELISGQNLFACYQCGNCKSIPLGQCCQWVNTVLKSVMTPQHIKFCIFRQLIN